MLNREQYKDITSPEYGREYIPKFKWSWTRYTNDIQKKKIDDF